MVILAWQALLAFADRGLLPPCLFHQATGYPCPTCGTTRAFLAVLHGDARAAIAYNPLVVIGGALLVGYVAVGLVIRARTGRFPEPAWNVRRLRLLRAAALVAGVSNWIYLVIAGV